MNSCGASCPATTGAADSARAGTATREGGAWRDRRLAHVPFATANRSGPRDSHASWPRRRCATRLAWLVGGGRRAPAIVGSRTIPPRLPPDLDLAKPVPCGLEGNGSRESRRAAGAVAAPSFRRRDRRASRPYGALVEPCNQRARRTRNARRAVVGARAIGRRGTRRARCARNARRAVIGARRDRRARNAACASDAECAARRSSVRGAIGMRGMRRARWTRNARRAVIGARRGRRARDAACAL